MKKFILYILLIISICSTLYLAYDKWDNFTTFGDIQEREQLFQATIWHLTSEEGFNKNDIHKIYIKYGYFKGGEYPFNYDAYVILKKDLSKAIIYGWTDKNKTHVHSFGESAAE